MNVRDPREIPLSDERELTMEEKKDLRHSRKRWGQGCVTHLVDETTYGRLHRGRFQYADKVPGKGLRFRPVIMDHAGVIRWRPWEPPIGELRMCDRAFLRYKDGSPEGGSFLFWGQNGMIYDISDVSMPA